MKSTDTPARRPGPLDDLLVKVGRGDRDAFGQLYDRITPLLLSRRQIGGATPDEAADQVRAGLVRLWRDAPGYPPGSGAMAWIWHHSHP
ncbi:hypothetical protein [Streptomyces sp. ODS05-4]|uniref:hypothetical protein n=1 Tax=Streptomyces sp. ODS05-4 TaxID=2944939 RepID=UPI00210A1F3A|nr:hypothetical protein [Streptomyces sp. ODS05-4]